MKVKISKSFSKILLLVLTIFNVISLSKQIYATTDDDIENRVKKDSSEISNIVDTKTKVDDNGLLQTDQQSSFKTPQISSAVKPVEQSPLTSTPSTSQRKPPPRVKLNKCCHVGEYLDMMQSCVAGASEHWIPLIYLIQQRRLTPKGESPRFITFEPNVRPTLLMLENDGKEKLVQCPMSSLELFTGSGKFVLFSNGSLYLRERGTFVEPRNYCVDNDVALVCLPKLQHPLNTTQLTLKKCCGKYGSYNATTKNCTFINKTDGLLKLSSLNESVYQTHYGFPECEEASSSYAIAGDWQEAQLDFATGYLRLPHKNLTNNEYCLEHLTQSHLTTDNDSNSMPVKIFACLHHFTPKYDIDGNLIHDINIASENKLQVAALNVGIVISVIFLGATLVAGCMMPSVHHVLHWRCQIYYVFCLFIAELLFAYRLLSTSLDHGSALCLLLASTMHFFFLAAFFWLNTMCFNIWWTFRDFRPSSLERNQEQLRLRLYSAYAWGFPLLISAIAACVDQLPETQLLRPVFSERCWFNEDHLSIFAYFFGPIGFLLCANIVLFISTTHQLTCGLWKRDDIKSTTEKTALGKVCLKLVVVMGVTWIADVISWSVGGSRSAWLFTDLINALQGVFIFIVVGCQPQVWVACKRFCFPHSRQEITNTTNGVQHSSSSQGPPSLAACGAEITQNTSIITNVVSGGNRPENLTQAKIPMETVC